MKNIHGIFPKFFATGELLYNFCMMEKRSEKEELVFSKRRLESNEGCIESTKVKKH